MIALWNLEPKYTNIALEKIRMYYELHHECVVDYLPLEHHLYEKIYCSSIFDYTDKRNIPDDVICGGSGFDLITILPKEIEEMKPKLNIGFTTRGCIRKCPFCIVPAKEGIIKVVGDIYDLWDRKSKELIIIDNNILALPDHFKTICEQIKKEDLQVDFNQGLDCRLLTEDIIITLKSIKCRPYRFAFDNLNYTNAVLNAIKLIKKYDLKETTWYVYCDEFESALERLLILKRHNQVCYLMRDRKVANQRKYSLLHGWASRRIKFYGMDFYDFVANRKVYREQKIEKNGYEHLIV